MTKAEAKQKVKQEGGWEMVKVFDTYHLMAWYNWSEGYVKKMRNEGMPTWKDGRRNRYDQQEVQDWLNPHNFFVPSGQSLKYSDNKYERVTIL